MKGQLPAVTNQVPDPCEPNHWDARWNREQREEALALAHEYIGDARAALDRLLREVEKSVETFQDAAKWLATVFYFKAVADSHEESV